MQSWLVWLIFAIICVVLGFVGYHFTVRTLRFVTAALALAVVVTATRYGVTHPGPGVKNPDLVNSFRQGFENLSHAFFRPLLGRNNPIPGRLGWLAIAGLFVFLYRELEVWAMHWQPPTVDTSAIVTDKPAQQDSSAPGEHDQAARDQRAHDDVINELRFRLPAVAVKSPPILPGGTKVTGLVSLAESTGNSVGGLVGAIISFVGTLWPNPRQYQVRVQVEPDRDEDRAARGTRVTVDVEDSRTGQSIAINTLVAGPSDEPASVVAGYVARHIFSTDPTAPPWCYGSNDGSDLSALLTAWRDRIHATSPADICHARRRQIDVLKKAESKSSCAGILRYELALLRDLSRNHAEALRLHAVNREQYPRFYRGRYRLGMSLEMIANPGFKLADDEHKHALCESLSILDRCGVTKDASHSKDDIKLGKPLPSGLRAELLVAARHELGKVRRQLSLWRVIWAAFVHRDERAIWVHYYRMQERQRFHDGARVAELLVAVRQSLGGHHRWVSYNLWRAMNITAAITGDHRTVYATLISDPEWQPDKDPQPGRHAQRTRWWPWLRRTPSWQAAYNTACLYAALTDMYDKELMAQRVVTSLRRAINDPYCEMGRASDWIEVDPDFQSVKDDPDFQSVKSPGAFANFLKHQKEKDYPHAEHAGRRRHLSPRRR
jgi:hypothetical protein